MTTPLAGLVSTDSRTFLRRLRRAQLWKMADVDNLTYPPGAPAEAMYVLFENLGVTGLEQRFAHITRPQQIPQQDEQGNVRMEVYPDQPAHATANKELDYDSAIERNADVAPPEEPHETDRIRELEERNAALTQKNAELETAINDRLTVLEQQALPISKMLRWQLCHIAEARGIAYKGLSKEELVDALGG